MDEITKGSMIAAIQSAQTAVGSTLGGGKQLASWQNPQMEILADAPKQLASWQNPQMQLAESATMELLEDLRDIANTHNSNTKSVYSILKEMFVFDKDAARRLRDQQAELMKEKEGSPSVVQDIKEGKKKLGVGKMVGLGAGLVALSAFMREINMDYILRLPQQVKSIKGIATFVSGVTKIGTLGLGAKFIDNATDSLKLFKTNFITRLGELKGIKLPSFVGLADKFKQLNFVKHIAESKAYKAAVSVLKGIKTGIAGVITPMTSAFQSVFGKSGALGKLLSPLKVIGKLVGKLFLPLTIIMGIFDGYQGFMEEFEKEGSILDGIRGAVTGIVDGFVGGLIRLGADVIGWMLEKLGLEHMADLITEFGENATAAFKTAVGGLVDIVTGIFTLDLERIWGGIKGLVGGTANFLVDTLTLPLNAMINFTKDLFKWGDPDIPFVLKDFILGGPTNDGDGLIPKLINLVKGLFSFDVTGIKEKIFDMGKIFKAMTRAGAAAVKAGLNPWDGVSAAEKYREVFDSIMAGGGTATETKGTEIAKSVVTDVKGNTTETNYKTETINNAGNTQEGNVTYVDNSAKNVSNVSSTKNEQFNGNLMTATDGYWITVDGQQYYV